MDFALRWDKTDKSTTNRGPHGVYEPVRGQDVNRPVSWDDEAGPLLGVLALWPIHCALSKAMPLPWERE